MGASELSEKKRNNNQQWMIGSFVAVVYGLLFVNYFDLTPHPYLQGYQLWLVALYFAPAVLLAGVWFRNLPLVIAMGLLASLMNDLFYAPMGIVYRTLKSRYVIEHPASYLQHFYTTQLGLRGSSHDFNYQAYFFNISVTSTVMGVSVLARFAVIILLYVLYAKR